MSAQRLPKVGEVWTWKMEPHDPSTVEQVCEWAVMTSIAVWSMKGFLASFDPPPEEPTVVDSYPLTISDDEIDMTWLCRHQTTHVVELLSDGTVRLREVGR